MKDFVFTCAHILISPEIMLDDVEYDFERASASVFVFCGKRLLKNHVLSHMQTIISLGDT